MQDDEWKPKVSSSPRPMPQSTRIKEDDHDISRRRPLVIEDDDYRRRRARFFEEEGF
jgi:hypothetical protein